MTIAHWYSQRRSLLHMALCAFTCALLATVAKAQDTSMTTTQTGTAEFQTEIRSGTVVYASGNDLVVRADNGGIRHFVVPDSQTFNVNGRSVSVHDIQAGTHLSETITTKTLPTVVTTTRDISGRVFHVNSPRSVILTLPDNTNQMYNIPPGQMFTINGRQQPASRLRRGMNVSATVVTEEPVTVVSESRTVTGTAPAPPAPPIPDRIPVLLVAVPTPAQPAPEQTAMAETPASLPRTGSIWPLISLLGLVSLGAGLLVRRFRMG